MVPHRGAALGFDNPSEMQHACHRRIWVRGCNAPPKNMTRCGAAVKLCQNFTRVNIEDQLSSLRGYAAMQISRPCFFDAAFLMWQLTEGEI